MRIGMRVDRSLPTTMRLVLGIAFWLAVTPAAASAPLDAVWARWLPETVRPGGFMPLSQPDSDRMELAFRDTLNGADNQQAWMRLGFALERPDSATLLIRERDNQGRGLYLLRPRQAGGLFIQAPHRFFDHLTGEITQRLFERGGVTGASWNTRHRHETENSDLAHVDPSPFTAFGRAIAATDPNARIVQLHGFNELKRSREGKEPADLIISSGTKQPSALVRILANCLRKAQLGTVRLYPTEVDHLGGTTNVTGRAVRAMGFSGFVHIETSHALRKKLLADPEALDRLATCLTG
ncbi:MAG: hypothetical protein HQL97_06450 [Magnetococcales bacterium]|nr:hypothetical protein [Magnetococcales bacterium]